MSARIQEVDIPGFGLVKSAGALIPERALAYIDAHYFLSDHTLAIELGISLATLKEFLKRHYDIRAFGSTELRQPKLITNEHRSNTDTATLLSGYEAQRGPKVAGKELNQWMNDNNHEPPTSQKNRSLYDKLLRYSGADEDALKDPKIADFLGELDPQNKEAVIKWHLARKNGPAKEAGRELNQWMNGNNHEPPTATTNNALYQKMSRYAGTDAEALKDPKIADFMGELDPENKEVVIKWHLARPTQTPRTN